MSYKNAAFMFSLMVSSCVFACDNDMTNVLNANSTNRVQTLSNQTINDVKTKLREYQKMGVQASEVLVVFDVDGTITNKSYPSSNISKTQPRADAVELVKYLRKQGVNVVISSAWDRFDETVGRLKHLKLSEVLDLEPNNQQYNDRVITVKDMKIYYHKEGLCASVKGDWGDAYFYRQKAVAPYVVYKPDILDQQIRYVLFLDDSNGNCEIFQEDVKAKNLYPNAQEVTLFALSEPDTENFLKTSLTASGSSWRRNSGTARFSSPEVKLTRSKERLRLNTEVLPTHESKVESEIKRPSTPESFLF